MRGAPAAALLAALVLAAPAAAAPATDNGCGTRAIAMRADLDRYWLGHTFVREGTDTVRTRQGRLQPGRDYVLDALRGELRLLTPPVPGETLWVSACWLLEPPPLHVERHRYQAAPLPSAAAPADSGAAALARPATARDVRSAPGGASLNVTGSKTVAVDFGSSQDAALRQSLDLALSGQLAPGVELTGVLSDRNTPLSVAGATQDVQALDRVLLELRAPQASASLGDLPLAVNRGSFARLERRVQGVSGAWHAGGFDGMVTAASAQGQYRRIDLAGVDGLQGPYLLTDADGNPGIAVVAGSEVVTVDGQRLARGESADYSVDYERGRLTFTSHRPVSSASRITVEYQYALTRFRRNLATFSGGWNAGRARLFATAITESDDRGRPLDATLGEADRRALALAGDSASRAIGASVVPGVGDYDSVRVAGGTFAYAYAGPDSGSFAVSFMRATDGRGDYADSAIVAGRTVYRWVGAGLGAFRVGRSLPLAQSHQLVALGGSAGTGALTLEAEGALSRFDANTFSPLDDRDNASGAGRMAVQLEGRGPAGGRLGVRLDARAVNRGFEPFARLERPFAEEDWGLPSGADLEHQRRADARAWWRPREGRELSVGGGRLTTPDGFTGVRREAEWTASGPLSTHALALDTDGDLAGARFGHGGRRRGLLEARRSGAWLSPSLRLESDDRRTSSDTARVRDRVSDAAGELASGTASRWHAAVSLAVRRERHDENARAAQARTGTWRFAADSPSGGAWGASVSAQRRDRRDLDSGRRTFSDLASARLRAEQRRLGLGGQLGVEATGEADNVPVRTLVYAGPGRGAYDAFGNFVGTGDYDLILAIGPALQRYTRVLTSLRASWQFGGSDTWRGSRVDFTLEDEARRRGALRGADVFLSTGLALVDPSLVHGGIVQRLEGDLAPGSHAAALHARLERRVTADRSFANFAQTTDQRSASLRWRLRPADAWSIESEGRAQWQKAGQQLGASRFDRVLLDEGAQAQLVWQPSPRVRASGLVDLGFSRPEGAGELTRTVRLGPELGLAFGKRGRADASVRRAFVSGPPALALLPSADPAGAPRWEGTARFDLRLHETTTFGVSGNLIERPGHATLTAGRAELRAFF